MSDTLVDSSIIPDILTEDGEWLEWSSSAHDALPDMAFRRDPLPWAAVTGMTLLTRDAARYRSYFPSLEVIAPE